MQIDASETLAALPRLQPQPISIEVLNEKYAKGGETPQQQASRVAHALAAVEEPRLRAGVERSFQSVINDTFIPAGRIQSAAGVGLCATLMNCFVQPIGDSMNVCEGGVPSIYKALSEASETMRRGGGVGYDFSPLRPKGALVKGTQSTSSGPVSFMNVFDASCGTVESAGARRGAQMGVLRCDHPDIISFIHAKDEPGRLENFNISVGITDAFMRAVVQGEDIDLWHQREPDAATKLDGAYRRDDGLWVYRRVPALQIFDAIMDCTYNHGEPGVLFLDAIARENNLYYCEQIAATNPCAEQPLPPYGCCDLGSINLTKFVRNPFSTDAYFDFVSMEQSVPPAVRMLDNALDATQWPLEQQRLEAQNKRRVGLGFLGLGSTLMMLGIAYDSDEGRKLAGTIAEKLRDAAYSASCDLAVEKGAFPLFSEAYLEGEFVKRLPENIRARIRQNGIRNSHLLSIAPTGTVTLAFADNCSSGLEPIFDFRYTRKKRTSNGDWQEFDVKDHAYRLAEHLGLDMHEVEKANPTALQIGIDGHIGMLSTIGPFVDSSMSKTVNIPADYPFDSFKEVYLRAWRSGLKGLATYRPNDVRGSVLTASSSSNDETVASPDFNPLTVPLDKRPLGALPALTEKVRYFGPREQVTTYISISFQQVEGVFEGRKVIVERPIEVFLPAGQMEEHEWISATMRLLSRAARQGTLVGALQDLREVVGHPVRLGEVAGADGEMKPLTHLSEVAALAWKFQNLLFQRGIIDRDGNEIPFEQRTQTGESLARRGGGSHAYELQTTRRIKGRCGNCGAQAMVKRDGCEICEVCNSVGSCG